MIKEVYIKRVSASLYTVLWLILICFDLFVLKHEGSENIPTSLQIIRSLLVSGAFLMVAIFFKKVTKPLDPEEFTTKIWRGFTFGLIAILVSFTFKVIFMIVGSPLNTNKYLINFTYHVELGLVIPYFVYMAFIWKSLILYQKSKSLANFLLVIELLFLLCILLNALGFQLNQMLFIGLTLILAALILIASFNQKWIAYINFANKLQAVFLFLSIQVSIAYFVTILVQYTIRFDFLTYNIFFDLFFANLVWFVGAYAFIGFLVLIFNLPTSSVLEEREDNLMGFQSLSQSVQDSTSVQDILKIYVDACMKASLSKAAWFEFNQYEKQAHNILKNISKTDVIRIQKQLDKEKFKSILDMNPSNIFNTRFTANLKDHAFSSLMFIPIHVNEVAIGNLYLLKDVSGGFTKEIKNIIIGYTNQLTVSIANLNMVQEAIKNERYVEERAIATRVQKSLLPGKLPICADFDISAFAISADEVGGDYYDVYQYNDHQYVMIMGDVSGKGTGAAFHMAQMKGLFYGLVQQMPSPKDFLIRSNAVLSKILSKKHFITLSYFIIDTKLKEMQYARAGHCPTLFYSHQTKKSVYLKEAGIGLGLYRSNDYKNHIDMKKLSYNKGDILVLYTDGIPEAKNASGREFGYKKLMEIIDDHAEYKPKEIESVLINVIDEFSKGFGNEDDYSALIVKFR